MRLPGDFDKVQLDAVRIGEGSCAVLATFFTTEVAQRRADEAWHRNHQPTPARGLRGRWRAEKAESSAQRHAQLARQPLHDTARRWLNRMCGGFFAANANHSP
jgi:hypothetical protein